MLRVLLVCTGNICRSPIAHGLLTERSQRLLGGEIDDLIPSLLKDRFAMAGES